MLNFQFVHGGMIQHNGGRCRRDYGNAPAHTREVHLVSPPTYTSTNHYTQRTNRAGTRSSCRITGSGLGRAEKSSWQVGAHAVKRFFGGRIRGLQYQICPVTGDGRCGGGPSLKIRSLFERVEPVGVAGKLNFSGGDGINCAGGQRRGESKIVHRSL